MIIYPAIDLRAGQCVRLRQGDFQQETVYGNDPGEMALHWQSQGAQALHLVDLDGAKSGRPTNLEALRSIRQAVTIPLQSVAACARKTTSTPSLILASNERSSVPRPASNQPGWV